MIVEYKEEKPVKGQLRFKNTTVDSFKKNWHGMTEYKILKEQRILQQYSGEEWKDVPSTYESIQINLED